MAQFIGYSLLAIFLLYLGYQVGRAIARLGKTSESRKNEEGK